MPKEKLILDAVDGFALTSAQVDEFSNELVTLRTNWRGLHYLCYQTRNLEQRCFRRDTSKVKVVAFGNIPGVAPTDLQMVSCFFDWYSVSACNLCSLVAWIANTADATTEGPDDYVRRLLPPILKHRHKVAAHYSRVWPKKDGPALQVASTTWKLGAVDDRFIINLMVHSRTHAGSCSDSSELEPWSLTSVHDDLAKRYDAALRHGPRKSTDGS